MKKIFGFIIVSVISLFTSSLVYAATANMSVIAPSSVKVGETFTVKIKVTSSTALGSFDTVISYDTDKLKLVSGAAHNVNYATGSNIKTLYNSNTIKFKAIDSGSSTISIKSAVVYSYSESSMTVKKYSDTVKALTQAQIEASYSKDNYLKSLSIEGEILSPTFNKETTEYTTTLGANAESIKVTAKPNDSESSIKGTGTVQVSEGENKIEIVVTAENGSKKTYTIIATVIDPNPITITDTNNNTLTVVKREGSLTCPNTFTSTTVTIDNQEIPAFHSEFTDYTIVGLKDKSGQIKYYIYDSDKKTYTLYTENLFNASTLYIIESDKEIIGSYKKTDIIINDVTYKGYKVNKNSEFSVIYAVDIETGYKGYYIYDEKTNSVIRYNDEITPIFNEEIDDYKFIVYVLCAESAILFIILFAMLLRKGNKNKIRRQMLKEKESKENKIFENSKEMKKKEKKLKVKKEKKAKDDFKF